MTTLADPGPVFAALADPTRRSVLTRLAARGSASATALARELPVTRQAVVQHGEVSEFDRGVAVTVQIVPSALRTVR